MSRSTLFFAVGLLLLTSASLNVFSTIRLRHASSAYASLNKQPLVSELPLSVRDANLEFIFGKHYDIANDAEWATLIPSNHGRVKLGEAQQEFDVGMYTDLECLDTIRAAYVDMRDGARMRSEAAEACLGQIRQVILCTADITLEPTHIICKDRVCPLSGTVATGEFVDHKCRDWAQVRHFVEGNQATWNS
ncbi:hypothetical protein B0H17DRAFT_327998 [Mycena rosella]|uniref:Uncharacterized protein n=1 Tax=Mycena rosella TaxID=1033263 RepID=A0AAD7CTG2_MYCRO|nr:hypothetical protein B0H17DRAFT_327998 [Mycena rosella]